MLIGPSGCGKTTTLKMINRLIEPTAGRILLDGEDVTHVNGDQLRRQIGYVIQQGGLFPHFSIADNIGVVPKMLGWDKQRIKERADELLHLVGLEPSTFRDRYPRQLSGGQQQRIGVARALAADPPVMLMDEPFGAIDPITRDRLQDEFLEIQRTVGKTIAFVTHDLQEAVKLGDKIAVFATGRLEQYDDPDTILTRPANDFVSDFVGGGAAVRRLSLLELARLELHPIETDEKAAGSQQRHAGGRGRRLRQAGLLAAPARRRRRRHAAGDGADLRHGLRRRRRDARRRAPRWWPWSTTRAARRASCTGTTSSAGCARGRVTHEHRDLRDRRHAGRRRPSRRRRRSRARSRGCGSSTTTSSSCR